MDYLLLDENLKKMEMVIFVLLAFIIVSVGLYNIDDPNVLSKGIYFIWILVFSYSFFGSMFNIVNMRNRKLFIYLFCLSFLFTIFILPNYFSEIKYINVVIVFYNIVFFLFLYFMSEISNKLLALMSMNFIALGSCIIFEYDLSTIVTYIISFGIIIYTYTNFNKLLFKFKNLHTLFFITGCFFQILLYFTVATISIFCENCLDFNWFLFFNLIQPLLYWIGINIVLMGGKIR